MKTPKKNAEEYYISPPVVNRKRGRKNVVFSLKAMNKLRKMQHEILFSKRYVQRYHPYTAMLGCDQKGVVKEIKTLVYGTTRVGGCSCAPSLSEEVLTKSILSLTKKELTPCGILRVGFWREESNVCIFTSLVGDSFRSLFKGTNWFSVGVFLNGMIIETCKTLNNNYRGYKPIQLGWDILRGGNE